MQRQMQQARHTLLLLLLLLLPLLRLMTMMAICRSLLMLTQHQPQLVQLVQ
jgi:hypothetical protein